MDVYPSLTYRDVEAALEWLAAASGWSPVIFDEEGVEKIRFSPGGGGEPMSEIGAGAKLVDR